MPGVSFVEATKKFDDVVAVDHLTLDVEDGEFLVLVGPSGCGKSTALRMIAGLEEVTSGALLIGGEDVTDVEPQDRDLAMVFQSYALYPHKTVRQNIEFPLKSRKVPAAERAARAERAAGLLGLGDLLERRPAQLSGGQRQRVALARAIVREPRVFLMDEPLSNLDAKTRVQTRAELSELHETLGATFIYVTHDQVEAMTMGTRIAVLDGGRLQQVGTPDEVYDRPANLFVAGFIGSPPMNTVDAAVDRTPDGGVALRIGTGRIELPAALARALSGAADGEVVVGVRPEHLTIGQGPIEATVKIVESLGHERHVVAELAGTHEHQDEIVTGALVIVRQSAEDPAPRTGERVGLSARPDQVHLFDRRTGERLA
ncbi:ABC transporter ATP-binding protein [Actinomarinicola tropica]|uniref:ATP-binding cassette domain-containing protein n=1 Tax=Actinomarinicola tropica TaxID=2789776 RepID=A0A5Q2RGH1_9ACTN|nr:ABC transporter ATP-binding protein [Actinomarinicola tropica]QGG94734.1 ATP-binding cassette domain-containing protein [Actinomarinicola tropica]